MRERPSRRLRGLVGFGLFGVTWWFFGNLYEELVLMPNFLVDAPGKRAHWLGFFAEVTPVRYYLPLGPLATLALVFAWLRARAEAPEVAAELRAAVLAVAAGWGVSAYIVPAINLRLFEPAPLPDELARPLAIRWLTLNAVRLVCVGFAAVKVLSAWTRLTADGRG
ncbi:hypothetical protein [Nannocystis exedens]|nr:hypothetical protein [Nannocystis exedens]